MLGLKNRGLEPLRPVPHGAAGESRTHVFGLEDRSPCPLDDGCMVEAVRIELTSLRLKVWFSAD